LPGFRSLYEGSFLSARKNLVFVGGTGTGKSHLAIAIAARAVRNGSRARFYNLVDLANLLEQEKLAGKGGVLAARLSRLDIVVLDELGYLPFSKKQRTTSVPSPLQALRANIGTDHDEPDVWRMGPGLRGRQDDHGAP